ncbi:M28 family peptidase [Segetibacter sp. 3557_3]|uniref:M28 family peptidase n=1 Tax=Segetibacter sp. 3557_3 TaxID=2547429 RepID=UPI001058AFC3|nr:M28 family peptidase [Segetibacter sp. 3557_3]TDH20893.1 M28 family peptidase [Segetibacter sp. 3557_3]
MKKFLSCLLMAGICSCAIAQADPAKYASTITEEDLRKQLTIVAGAEMQGRETATEGERKAAAYIASEFSRIGLKPAPGTNNFRQAYPLFYDTINTSLLVIDGQTLAFGKDYSVSAQVNKSRKIKAKKIVFVGYGISDNNYDDYAGKRVRGKVVLMFSGEPKTDSLYRVNSSTRPSKWSFGTIAKLQLARKKGARAVLFVSPLSVSPRPEAAGIRRTNIYYPQKDTSRHTNIANLSHEAAAAIIGKEKFDVLLSQVKTGQALNNENLIFKKRVEYNFQKSSVPQSSANIVGYLEGTDKKDEYVVLTAHYDHIGMRNGIINYGADDDGSGTVNVIEMAEAFAKAKADGNGPRRTIVFMTVSGEEKGLWGSQYYTEHPLFPLSKTSVDLNTDMIGRIDPNRKYGDSTNYVYVIGEDKLSSELLSITDEVNTKFTKLELDRKYNDLKDPNRFYYRSDHYNFAKNGVPIIFYFDGVHADYHRPTDTVDKINFDIMTRRARLIFHTAWVMANRDKMLLRDTPLR